jgi:sigma-E factor negative regulatory protein RseA
VAAIGWTAVGGLASKPEQAQLASAPPGTVLAETQRGVMIRDARLDEFLAAHRQLGGASALQMPAGFLRNATFEGPIR